MSLLWPSLSTVSKSCQTQRKEVRRESSVSRPQVKSGATQSNSPALLENARRMSWLCLAAGPTKRAETAAEGEVAKARAAEAGDGRAAIRRVTERENMAKCGDERVRSRRATAKGGPLLNLESQPRGRSACARSAHSSNTLSTLKGCFCSRSVA